MGARAHHSWRTENGEQNAPTGRRAGPLAKRLRRFLSFAARLSQRTRRTTVQAQRAKPSTAKRHKARRKGNRRFRRFVADLGAGYRRQDCQNIWKSQRILLVKQILFLFLCFLLLGGVWGAAPRPGRGKHPLHPQARLRRANKRRGRTYRTYRTYRTGRLRRPSACASPPLICSNLCYRRSS